MNSFVVAMWPPYSESVELLQQFYGERKIASTVVLLRRRGVGWAPPTIAKKWWAVPTLLNSICGARHFRRGHRFLCRLDLGYTKTGVVHFHLQKPPIVGVESDERVPLGP
jgi:hypothetical protein